MKPFLLRIFLATVVPMVVMWVLFEYVWIEIRYDMQAAELERELVVRGEALRDRFNGLDPAAWDGAVQDYNDTTDQLLMIIRDSRPAWDELYARVQSEGENGLLSDGYEAFVAFLLDDGRTLLRNDIIFFESAGLNWHYWGFVLLAMGLSYGLLYWTLRPMDRRLRRLADATDRIAAQQPIEPIPIKDHDAVGRIEQRLNALNESVQEAVAGLHDSIGTQRDLLHAVAHEFRGPIGRIRFAHDMLADVDNEQVRSDLSGRIDQAVDELEELMTEVLGYSRIRHGGYRPDIAPIDLESLVGRTLEKVRQEHPAISFELSGDCPEVEADARMLERALINIVRNAGRFAEQRVLVAVTADDRDVSLAVHDDGPGVAPGKRERVFEPFTRLDASRARETGGSGLGLAIVSAIALQHGGEVTCADSPEGGALFILRWPLSRA
ncbi:MAG: ATP-binding protein [Pseudomonadota bacterium]